MACAYGIDIERFGVADAGERACGDIADGVAASFARRDADRAEPPHDGRRVVDVDEVILEILPCRDVKHAVGIFLGEIGQHVHLIGVQAAKRDLDALHSRSVPEGVRSLGQVGRVVQFLRADAVVPMTVVVALAITSPS